MLIDRHTDAPETITSLAIPVDNKISSPRIASLVLAICDFNHIFAIFAIFRNKTTQDSHNIITVYSVSRTK